MHVTLPDNDIAGRIRMQVCHSITRNLQWGLRNKAVP
jgi:hypothetical protein